jgi:hypothetical protein
MVFSLLKCSAVQRSAAPRPRCSGMVADEPYGKVRSSIVGQRKLRPFSIGGRNRHRAPSLDEDSAISMSEDPFFSMKAGAACGRPRSTKKSHR